MKTPASRPHRAPKWTRLASFGLALLLALPGLTASAAQPDIDLAALPAAQARWQSSMAAFAAADREHLPDAGGVLFVGSSTIRLWSSLAQDFRQLPIVINRGFGGSTMADCDYFARLLVIRYKPKEVLVYAGENDLAEGRSALQVLESFSNFVRAVRSELPDTRISYISIKPSPSRAALMVQARETNKLLASYVGTLENAQYIDIFNPMLGLDGAPKAELFRADRLHLNDAGYALWQAIIGSRVAAPTIPAAAPVASLPVPATAPLTAAAILPLRQHQPGLTGPTVQAAPVIPAVQPSQPLLQNLIR
jgi:lysophospholipase L1-like esterase